jgi:ubiquinone/menaquinone biosynthesis C-methylase UbiE
VATATAFLNDCSLPEDVIMTAAATVALDTKDLEAKVKAMYRRVAEDPHGEFHFEMGRALAERLGYPPVDLNHVPPEAIESFAGVGYCFDLAGLREGETVVDLGSGSGMDTFVAAFKVRSGGRVIGVDMTDEQKEKAEWLRHRGGFHNVAYLKGYIDSVPLPDAVADVVISNGVINLAPDKAAVFREAARLLKPGGRLAIADIVTELPLPDSVVCNATLWAACIGGALQQQAYRGAIEAAGLRVTAVRDNPAYRFISANAKGAQQKWGVKSNSFLAVRP